MKWARIRLTILAFFMSLPQPVDGNYRARLVLNGLPLIKGIIRLGLLTGPNPALSVTTEDSV